jgi:hypothetical protein
MNRERFHLDIEFERLEAADAFQFHRLGQGAGRPKGSFGNTEIERVSERPGANDVFAGEIGDGAFFLAFEVQPVGLDLAEVNFHCTNRSIVGRLCQTPPGRPRRFTDTPYNFFLSALATRAGTKSVTSPPSRAISFTMRELR